MSISLDTTKLEEFVLTEEVFEMVGFTIDDKQDFFMMITKSANTYSVSRYQVKVESETKKMSEME